VIRAVLDEDLICRTFPLNVKPADVRIAPAEEFFKKPGLPAKSTPRLPGMNAGACSGLTLSLDSRPRLERRGLASANG
jgi:hypothetical protein